eukprot:PhM_4_TR11083/c0_g1_i1/m.95215
MFCSCPNSRSPSCQQVQTKTPSPLRPSHDAAPVFSSSRRRPPDWLFGLEPLQQERAEALLASDLHDLVAMVLRMERTSSCDRPLEERLRALERENLELRMESTRSTVMMDSAASHISEQHEDASVLMSQLRLIQTQVDEIVTQQREIRADIENGDFERAERNADRVDYGVGRVQRSLTNRLRQCQRHIDALTHRMQQQVLRSPHRSPRRI